jgi:mRNA interferase MazF
MKSANARSGTAQRATGSKTTSLDPVRRGDVWYIDLREPPRGREEGGKDRPALIFSVDQFNKGPADLVIVVPIASKDKGIISHIAVNPPAGGLKTRSFIKCEAIRSITKDRLRYRMGTVDQRTMDAVADITKVLLGIH